MHTRTLHFGNILKDRVRPPDQPIAQQESTQGAIVKLDREGLTAPVHLHVDYKAIIGLSLLRVPQQSVWPGAPHA
jgi:hypothetical protein